MLAIFTRSLPCVRRGFYIRNTASFHFVAFSSICVCRPLLFGGCSFATPSRLAPLKLCPWIRYARRADFNFFRADYATIPTLHFPTAVGSFRSRSSAACQLPQHRHCAPQSFRCATFFAVLGGVLFSRRSRYIF